MFWLLILIKYDLWFIFEYLSARNYFLSLMLDRFKVWKLLKVVKIRVRANSLL